VDSVQLQMVLRHTRDGPAPEDPPSTSTTSWVQAGQTSPAYGRAGKVPVPLRQRRLECAPAQARRRGGTRRGAHAGEMKVRRNHHYKGQFLETVGTRRQPSAWTTESRVIGKFFEGGGVGRSGVDGGGRGAGGLEADASGGLRRPEEPDRKHRSPLVQAMEGVVARQQAGCVVGVCVCYGGCVVGFGRARGVCVVPRGTTRRRGAHVGMYRLRGQEGGGGYCIRGGSDPTKQARLSESPFDPRKGRLASRRIATRGVLRQPFRGAKGRPRRDPGGGHIRVSSSASDRPGNVASQGLVAERTDRAAASGGRRGKRPEV